MLHAQWLQNILDRWNNDDKYRKSLSDIGWSKEQVIQYDEIVLEDRSYVATQQERSRNEKSWKLSSNAEGIQRPLNQRSDFKEANQTFKRLYHEKQRSLEVETNLSLQGNKSDKGLVNS